MSQQEFDIHNSPSSLSKLREIGLQEKSERIHEFPAELSDNEQTFSDRKEEKNETKNLVYFPKYLRLVPGLSVVAVLASASLMFNEKFDLPSALCVLVMGIALNMLLSLNKSGIIIAQLDPGFGYSTKTILRTGVALLGFQLTFTQVLDLGPAPIILSFMIVGLTLWIGFHLGRRLGLSPDFAMIATGATAICGASAALAIASSFPRSSERDSQTVIAIMIVTLLSSLAMITYPLLAHISGFNDSQAGLLFGATIHDVAQVVGAGLLFGGSSVEVAAYSKMLRVAMLAPVVIILAAIARHHGFGGSSKKDCSGIACTLSNLMPPHFIAIFALIVVFNSLVPVPEIVIASAFLVSKLALLMGLCALAMKLNIGQLTKAGSAPIVLITANTVFVLLLAYFGILFTT